MDGPQNCSGVQYYCAMGWAKFNAVQVGHICACFCIGYYPPELRGLNSGWARGGQNGPKRTRLLPSMALHCRARSRTLRTPIAAMALRRSAADPPCHLLDFPYATNKTGGDASPQLERACASGRGPRPAALRFSGVLSVHQDLC